MADTAQKVTTVDMVDAAGWAMPRGCSTPRAFTDAVDAGVLRPVDPHPGYGVAIEWSDGDLADAKVVGNWRQTTGGGLGSAYLPLLARVLDLWRAVGRPDGWVGTFDGAPRCWTIPAAVWVDVQSGSAVVAVRAEGP